jgi:hypothetical protein
VEAAQGSQAARHSNSQPSHAGRGEQAQPWELPTAKRQKRGATRSRAPSPRTRLARPLPKVVTRRLDVDLSNKELHPYQRPDRSCVPYGGLSVLDGYVAIHKEVLGLRRQRLLFMSNGIGNTMLIWADYLSIVACEFSSFNQPILQSTCILHPASQPLECICSMTQMSLQSL